MMPLDADISKARALVVDGNAGSRSALMTMLRDFGVPDVSQVSRAQDARKLLETQRFDIVLCEYHFEGEPVSGQDIMDDLRLAQILPLSTVIVMISSEAGYGKVAEAAEAALDAYLIKPHTTEALRERLATARRRKQAIKDILALIEKGAHVEAAEMCQLRFETRGPAWVYAARIGAELWLRVGKPHAAQVLFDALLQIGAVPWARLGVARSQYDGGGTAQARRTLESLLNDLPSYADAYDVQGRVLLDQGHPELALDALRRATALTPGSVARLVKHGLLAFYYGDPAEAAESLTKAARLGLNSRIFDLQGLVLLAAVQFDQRDRRGLAQSLHSISAARAAQPNSARLRRFETVNRALYALLERRVGDAVSDVKALIGEILEPNFEFEAACNLLALLSRLTSSELKLDDLNDDVVKLAQRFAVSHTTTELLVRAVRGLDPFAATIRTAYAGISNDVENAVSKTVAGAPSEAVQILLASAEKTLNSKLIDLALHTIDRHRESIEGADRQRARAQRLHDQYRVYGTQVHLSRGSDPRIMTGVAKV